MIKILLKSFNDTQQTAEEFFALTDKNRAYLREWLPWLDFVQKVADTHKFLSDNCQSDKLGTTLSFFICDNDKIIGTINLREISPQSALVGYWLDKSYSGQGITTHALQQLIKIVQEKNLTQQLILRCNPQNMGSKKIALKCRFSYQETLKNAENLYGVDCDLEVYVLQI
ncbi:MAG: GNAT family N-acetyltransferase [Moraxellaceae bacterium]|nr:GNAT family N-acetyltransferase [Moraxellaceae bacterium]